MASLPEINRKLQQKAREVSDFLFSMTWNGIQRRRSVEWLAKCPMSSLERHEKNYCKQNNMIIDDYVWLCCIEHVDYLWCVSFPLIVHIRCIWYKHWNASKILPLNDLVATECQGNKGFWKVLKPIPWVDPGFKNHCLQVSMDDSAEPSSPVRFLHFFHFTTLLLVIMLLFWL